MQRCGVDAQAAKKLVVEDVIRYETRSLEACDTFRWKSPVYSEKLDRYLTGLAHAISGNLVWSLNCPRYNPQYRYDPNAGLEGELIAKVRGQAPVPRDEMPNTEHLASLAAVGTRTRFSPVSGHPNDGQQANGDDLEPPREERLGTKVSAASGPSGRLGAS